MQDKPFGMHAKRFGMHDKSFFQRGMDVESPFQH